MDMRRYSEKLPKGRQTHIQGRLSKLLLRSKDQFLYPDVYSDEEIERKLYECIFLCLGHVYIFLFLYFFSFYICVCVFLGV